MKATLSNDLDVMIAVTATEDELGCRLFGDEKCRRGLACVNLEDEGDSGNRARRFAICVVNFLKSCSTAGYTLGAVTTAH